MKAFGGLQPTADEQLARAKTFTAKNAAYLKRQGIPINRASLYAAHFFGPVTAAKVIGADVEARADHIAGSAGTNANPPILKGKTGGQFLSGLLGTPGGWAEWSANSCSWACIPWRCPSRASVAWWAATGGGGRK